MAPGDWGKLRTAQILTNAADCLAFEDQMREFITISPCGCGGWAHIENIVGQILMDRSKQMSSLCGGVSIHAFLERKEIINAYLSRAFTRRRRHDTCGRRQRPGPRLAEGRRHQIIGAKGQANGGVYQFGVPRRDSITEHGASLVPPGPTGVATAINFQPTGGGK